MLSALSAGLSYPSRQLIPIYQDDIGSLFIPIESLPGVGTGSDQVPTLGTRAVDNCVELSYILDSNSIIRGIAFALDYCSNTVFLDLKVKAATSFSPRGPGRPSMRSEDLSNVLLKLTG